MQIWEQASVLALGVDAVLVSVLAVLLASKKARVAVRLQASVGLRASLVASVLKAVVVRVRLSRQA